MKKMTLFLVMIVCILLMLSCTNKEENTVVVVDKDGIKNYTNTSIPSDPNSKLDLIKLFTITGENDDSLASFNKPVTMTADKDGNIYILDYSSESLKKFDKEGKFVKSIGRRGQGPGELSYPSFVAIYDDTLSVMCGRLRKVSRFTLEGEFINDKKLEMEIQLPKTYDNKNVIGYINTVDEENQSFEFSLSLLNKDFNITIFFEKINIRFQDLSSGKVKQSDLLIPFVPANGKVYLSENDENQYKINEYDLTGKKTATIKKEYRKIKNSEEEQEANKAYFEKRSGGRFDDSMKLDPFKKAFSAMYYDKYGRLLIVPEIDRSKDLDGSYIDIFKDGVFQNRVDFEINKGNMNLGGFSSMQKRIFFVGERMYMVNMDETIVDVYDY